MLSRLSMRTVTGTVLAVVAMLALSAHPTFAQTLFGSIVGNVTDATGAAVPGATVKITEAGTNEVRTADTNESGNYTISTVTAGTYTVAIEKSGFRGSQSNNILVNQNNVVRVDAQLQVGQQSEKVEVTAEA